MKNIMPLGFRDVIIDPLQKTTRMLKCGTFLIQTIATLPTDQITLIPIQTRLTTPTHFSTTNIVADAITNALNPTKERVIATKSPKVT